ncbi:MAG TPA: VWA domain-containing protein [Candidatus Saccharimonadales bacterium]|nr:VWA domain-containing protein [Candidatus Saccharimonadales bacterium]
MGTSRARIALGDITKEVGDDQAMLRRVRVALGEIDKTNEAVGFDISDGRLAGGVMLDSSVSMRPWYQDGTVQVTTERIAGYFAPIDKTYTLECGYFDTEARQVEDLSLRNRAYVGFVNRTVPRLGSTNLYAAILVGVEMAAQALNDKRILDYIKPKKTWTGRSTGEWDIPTHQLRPLAGATVYELVIVTDGAPTAGITDPIKIMELLIRLSYVGIFVKFVYVGNDSAGKKFLQDLDDMDTARHPKDPRPEDVDPTTYRGRLPLRYIDNVDKVEIGDPRNATDEAVAAAMNNELGTYLPSAVRRGLLTGV